MSTDAELLEVIRNNIETNLASYRLREEEYRLLARTTSSLLEQRRYIAVANRYKSYIDNINATMNNIVIGSSGIRQPTRIVQSPVQQLLSSIRSERPKPDIATSTPLKIPKELPQDIPNQFLCPITMDIMSDPVMLTDGHVYERKAIEKWLETNNKSPLTNNPIKKDIIIPCFTLRSLMQDYFEKFQRLQQPVQLKIPAPTPPQQSQKQSKTKNTAKKKREPTAYNLFVKERMPILKVQNQKLPATEIMKLIGAEWRASK